MFQAFQLCETRKRRQDGCFPVRPKYRKISRISQLPAESTRSEHNRKRKEQKIAGAVNNGEAYLWN